MQNRKLRNLITFITGIFILSSCTSDYIVPEPSPPSGAQVSYATQIQPYFNSNCISCHATGSDAPDLTEGKSYQALMSMNLVNTATPEKSRLYEKINTGGSMNQHSTVAGNKLVLSWIQQGAKNN